MNRETFSEAFVSRRVSDARAFVQTGAVLTREVRGPELVRLKFKSPHEGVQAEFIASFHCRIKRVLVCENGAKLVELRGVSADARFWTCEVPLSYLQPGGDHRRLHRAVGIYGGTGDYIFPGRLSAFCRALLHFARDDGIPIKNVYRAQNKRK